MNATLQTHQVGGRYQFNVEVDQVTYQAIIYTNAKGRFIDDEVSYPNGEPLIPEGHEGEIREEIINYLAENWDTLVPAE